MTQRHSSTCLYLNHGVCTCDDAPKTPLGTFDTLLERHTQALGFGVKPPKLPAICPWMNRGTPCSADHTEVHGCLFQSTFHNIGCDHETRFCDCVKRPEWVRTPKILGEPCPYHCDTLGFVLVAPGAWRRCPLHDPLPAPTLSRMGMLLFALGVGAVGLLLSGLEREWTAESPTGLRGGGSGA